MDNIEIKRVEKINRSIGDFIADSFELYSDQNNVSLEYDEFCFVAEDSEGEIIGAITGRALYNEVHIKDLIIKEEYRKKGLGSKLIKNVEDAYRNKGYNVLTLTTFAFQAPEFYKKLGFTVEFIRRQDDSRLDKYFLKKDL